MSKVCRVGFPLNSYYGGTSSNDNGSVSGLKYILNSYHGKEKLLYESLLCVVYNKPVYKDVINGRIYTKGVRLNQRERDTLRTMAELTELPQTRVSALLVYFHNLIDHDTERAGALIEELSRLGYQVKIIKTPSGEVKQ